jgi:hypothetical protein
MAPATEIGKLLSTRHLALLRFGQNNLLRLDTRRIALLFLCRLGIFLADAIEMRRCAHEQGVVGNRWSRVTAVGQLIGVQKLEGLAGFDDEGLPDIIEELDFAADEKRRCGKTALESLGPDNVAGRRMDAGYVPFIGGEIDFAAVLLVNALTSRPHRGDFLILQRLLNICSKP